MFSRAYWQEKGTQDNKWGVLWYVWYVLDAILIILQLVLYCFYVVLPFTNELVAKKTYSAVTIIEQYHEVPLRPSFGMGFA